MNETPNQPHLLLVEDDPAQADLVRMGLDSSCGGFSIDHVLDGEAALAYLRQEKPYAGSPRPDVVFLDLNLPRISGIEVLQQIKRDASLCMIPIVVLSTSESDNDRSAAYAHGVNSYVKKPVGFENFQQMCQDLRQYWMSRNLPPVWEQAAKRAG